MPVSSPLGASVSASSATTITLPESEVSGATYGAKLLLLHSGCQLSPSHQSHRFLPTGTTVVIPASEVSGTTFHESTLIVPYSTTSKLEPTIGSKSTTTVTIPASEVSGTSYHGTTLTVPVSCLPEPSVSPTGTTTVTIPASQVSGTSYGEKPLPLRTGLLLNQLQLELQLLPFPHLRFLEQNMKLPL